VVILSKYIIEPGHGWENGKFDPGNCCGNLHECELAWRLAKGISEQLEERGVHHLLLDNRMAPGPVKPAWGFRLSIHLGANPKRPDFQGASVQESPIAEGLAQIIEHWGKITTPRWESVKVRRGASEGCRVEVFDVLALDSLLLAERLPALARSLGEYLARACVRSALRLQ
jgi:hypothetical protein